MKVLRTVLLILVVSACSIFLYRHAERNTHLLDRFQAAAEDDVESPDDEAPSGELEIHAIGRLLPAGGVITIAAAPGQRLDLLHVAEGQEVRKDQPLGRLASHDLLEKNVVLLQKRKDAAAAKQAADKSVARARVRQAELAERRAREQKDQDLAIKNKQVRLLADRHELAKSQFEKLKQLGDEDPELVTPAEIDKQKLLVDQARLDWEEAELALQFAPETADRAIEAAEADKNAASAALEQLENGAAIEAIDAEIDVARQELEMSELRSPIAATVLKIYSHQGDFVVQKPIMQVADLTRVVCVAQVYESDAKRVEKGQLARISSPAFSSPYDKKGILGVVQRVGKMVASPSLEDLNPLAPRARHVVEVEIDIQAPDPAEKESDAFRQSATLVDLQVNVVFLRRKGRSAD